LNSNVHFHIVAAEAASVPTEHGARTLKLARLQPADVQELARRLALCGRRSLLEFQPAVSAGFSGGEHSHQARTPQRCVWCLRR
jgi:hypothetical protein